MGRDEVTENPSKQQHMVWEYGWRWGTYGWERPNCAVSTSSNRPVHKLQRKAAQRQVWCVPDPRTCWKVRFWCEIVRGGKKKTAQKTVGSIGRSKPSPERSFERRNSKHRPQDDKKKNQERSLMVRAAKERADLKREANKKREPGSGKKQRRGEIKAFTRVKPPLSIKVRRGAAVWAKVEILRPP